MVKKLIIMKILKNINKEFFVWTSYFYLDFSYMKVPSSLALVGNWYSGISSDDAALNSQNRWFVVMDPGNLKFKLV